MRAVAGKDLVPYLPQLMEFLLSAVTSAPSYHAKSLAISAIGAAGMCEDNILSRTTF